MNEEIPPKYKIEIDSMGCATVIFIIGMFILLIVLALTHQLPIQK